MSRQAIEALRAERELVLALAASLTDDEWALPSDCEGWRVQEVIAHMAAVFHSIADPASIEQGTSTDVEANAEVPIAVRRTWTPAQVLAEYVEWSDKGIAALAAMQEYPLNETEIPLGNLGTHPMHLLANALVFDHYCHLRWDLLAPNGPLARDPLPSDDLRLQPTMEWMLAGLPQMCPEVRDLVRRPINFEFTGPGGGSWVLAPVHDGAATFVPGADPDAAATVTSSTHDFVCWGTKRRDWRDMAVTVTGDRDHAAAVLDAINVI